MSDALSQHGAFLLVVLACACGLALAYRESKMRMSVRGTPGRLWDYVLLWPLLFESSASVVRSRRLLTARELIGWLIVLALMAIGFVFF
jgi:hypothetical protein